MEPRYRSLKVALVPQPRQMPPPAFAKEDLQRIFADVIQKYSYQAFSFTMNQRGAQFSNGDEDMVELRPAAFEIQAKMDGPDVLTEPMATDKVSKIFKIASERLKVDAFLQCAVGIVASVDAPEGDAMRFVGEHLMHDAERLAGELGRDYFGGGVRFRRFVPPAGEDDLKIEPDINDNSLIYVEWQRGRVAAAGPIVLDQVSTWIDESFEVVSGATMRILSP